MISVPAYKLFVLRSRSLESAKSDTEKLCYRLQVKFYNRHPPMNMKLIHTREYAMTAFVRLPRNANV